jgi:predicted nuclease with TOPRIM domain
MINLEQVKLLEAKVAKTIDFVDRISKENVTLVQRESELQEKLESYQKRIDELEVLIMGFKEEQGRIEDGILAALDRLSQFEDAIEKSMKEKPHSKPAKDAVKSHGHTAQKAAAKAAAVAEAAEVAEAVPAAAASSANAAVTEPVDSGASNDCFEIPDDEVVDDILDPLTEAMDEEATDGDSPSKGGELDIF